MPRNEFYISKAYEQIYKSFRKICDREGRSPSRVICQMMRDYVLKHGHGNPQAPLIPDMNPAIEYSRLPVERRRQVMQDLYDTIKANPGRNVHQLIAKFSIVSGLRRVTLREYLRTLQESGKIKVYGSKVYVTKRG